MLILLRLLGNFGGTSELVVISEHQDVDLIVFVLHIQFLSLNGS